MSWERAIAFTLRWEGGYVNNPADRGGPTNRGITQGTLSSAYASGIVKHNNIKELTKTEAMAIYKARFWAPYDWGRYGEPVDMIMFDMAVNHGMGNAARIAQRACASLGAFVVIDGKWGSQTREALYKLAWKSALALSKMLLVKRLNFYDAIIAARPNQKRFRNGWRNRTFALAKACGVRIA